MKPISWDKSGVFLLKIYESHTDIRKHLITRMRCIDRDREMCTDDIEREDLHRN